MIPTTWAPAEPFHLLAIGLAACALALLLSRALTHVGFGLVETSALVVAAPLLSTAELPWAILARGDSIVFANVAGFVVPLLIGAKALASRAIRFAPTLAAIAAVSLTAYWASIAVPDEGILLFYRVPALVAGGVAVAFCWKRWREAGIMAFVAGSCGVVLGADLARLPELLAAEGARRIVLGGAGVFDGIFLVGVLGALLVVVVAGADRALAALRKPAPAPVASTREFTWVRPE